MEGSLAAKRKAGVESNILSTQKVAKKKKPLFILKSLKKDLKFILLCCFIFPAFYYAKIFISSISTKQKNTYSISNISFTEIDPDFKIDEFNKELPALVFETDDLKQLAKNIQKKFGFSHIHIFRDFTNSIFLKITVRKPTMLIQADKLRLLSEDGEVFSDPTATSTVFKTVLTGVLSDNHKDFIFDEKNCLQMSDYEKQIIREAMDLNQQANAASIVFSTIDYRKFRGFFTKITDSNTMVSFGKPPFEKKIKRLVKILSDYSKKQATVSNIEIDYSDKVFVTESKS